MNRLPLIIIFVLPSIRSIIVKDPPASGFEYSYNVDDPTTGDSKSQHEVRSGDTVTGSYSVLDPDGTKRIVDYTADPRSGFKAVVHTEPAVRKAPSQNYEAFQAYIPERVLYTAALPASILSVYYLGGVQNNAIPFYPSVQQDMAAKRQDAFFFPTQDKKTILKDSLGPGRYFLPSSTRYYHQ